VNNASDFLLLELPFASVRVIRVLLSFATLFRFRHVY
jgi:hypothetical protein